MRTGDLKNLHGKLGTIVCQMVVFGWKIIRMRSTDEESDFLFLFLNIVNCGIQYTAGNF